MPTLPGTSQGAGPVATSKQVSPAGYWIAAALLVIGCGGALVWFIVTVVGMVPNPSNYARTTIPGQITERFEEGSYTVFYESPAARASTYSAPQVRVWNGDEPVLLNETFLTSSYVRDGRAGSSIARFRVRSPGVYRIEVIGEPQPESFQVAVGLDESMAGVGGILGSMALGGLSFLVALVLLIVTVVRRGKAKRANQPQLPPYGAPPQYPPPQYPPPQYQPGQNLPPQQVPHQPPGTGTFPSQTYGVWPPVEQQNPPMQPNPEPQPPLVGDPVLQPWSSQPSTPSAGQFPTDPPGPFVDIPPEPDAAHDPEPGHS